MPLPVTSQVTQPLQPVTFLVKQCGGSKIISPVIISVSLYLRWTQSKHHFYQKTKSSLTPPYRIKPACVGVVKQNMAHIDVHIYLASVKVKGAEKVI